MQSEPQPISDLPKAPPVSESESVASGQTPSEMPGAFQLFGPSWQALKLNFWTFIQGVIIPCLVFVVPLAAAALSYFILSSRTDSNTAPNVSPIINVVLLVVGFVGVIGMIATIIFLLPFMYTLKLLSAKGVKIGFRATLKNARPYIWRILGLYIIRGLIILAGFILFIVPGLFMWRRYMLAPFYLLDKNTKIMEAMKMSAADSKPFSGAIWGMIGVYVIIGLAGIIPLAGYILGPVMGIAYCCAQATRYLQVQKAKA